MPPPPPTLRIARPTNSLSAMRAFYIDGLGLSILGSFEKHAGFDGIMLGHPSYHWHLEFTYQDGVEVQTKAPSHEHLLVFYFEGEGEWRGACEKLRNVIGKEMGKGMGEADVKSGNPYWDPPRAATFEDPEGWRVVLCNGKWPEGN